MKGILGNAGEGAFSIVINGGYEDDIDEGDVMWVIRSPTPVVASQHLTDSTLELEDRVAMYVHNPLPLLPLALWLSLTSLHSTVGTD